MRRTECQTNYTQPVRNDESCANLLPQSLPTAPATIKPKTTFRAIPRLSSTLDESIRGSFPARSTGITSAPTVDNLCCTLQEEGVGRTPASWHEALVRPGPRRLHCE